MKLSGLSIRLNVKARKDYQSFNNLFFNFLALVIVILVCILIAWGAKQVVKPFDNLISTSISLDYYSLCIYSLQSLLRMLAALILAVIVSLIYAKIAAINSYFEQILIPLLDVLQSIPILGFISFTVTMFLNLFPGKIIGAELACIFAIFTSQVWNMIFSFYYSLKNIPADLEEITLSLKMSPWQKFWRLEVPYAIPNMVFNIIVSMASGWFFLVASEVVSVGNTKISLPGIGSYIAVALDQGNHHAILAAIIAIVIVIFCSNKLFLEPLLLWSEKFQYASSSSLKNNSFIFNLFQKELWITNIFLPLKYLCKFLLSVPLFNLKPSLPSIEAMNREYIKRAKIFYYLWYIVVFLLMLISCWHLFEYLTHDIIWSDVLEVFYLTLVTLSRICVMMFLCSVVWVPIGIYIGLHPRFAQHVQPVVQFLAAFPVNLLFPVCAIIIHKYNLNPNIWLSPLIIIGAQWYILFNIIAATLSFPGDLTDVVEDLEIRGVLWWRKVIIPAILPNFITSLIVAFGAAWNASIVAELVSFRGSKIMADGIGSYIAEKTIAGNFTHITLGIMMMLIFVVVINRALWTPLHNFILQKFT